MTTKLVNTKNTFVQGGEMDPDPLFSSRTQGKNMFSRPQGKGQQASCITTITKPMKIQDDVEKPPSALLCMAGQACSAESSCRNTEQSYSTPEVSDLVTFLLVMFSWVASALISCYFGRLSVADAAAIEATFTHRAWLSRKIACVSFPRLMQSKPSFFHPLLRSASRARRRVFSK